MSSSDIYQVKESPWVKPPQEPKKPRRRRRHTERFDEATKKDASKTNRRRSKNSGTRRFFHLMKKPGFSKRFWAVVFVAFGLVVGAIILWDTFFRYSEPEPAPESGLFDVSNVLK